MAIKLNCLDCGRSFELGDAYEDYEGEVRCWICSTSLIVKLADGKLKSMSRALAPTELGNAKLE